MERAKKEDSVWRRDGKGTRRLRWFKNSQVIVDEGRGNPGGGTLTGGVRPAWRAINVQGTPFDITWLPPYPAPYPCPLHLLMPEGKRAGFRPFCGADGMPLVEDCGARRATRSWWCSQDLPQLGTGIFGQSHSASGPHQSVSSGVPSLETRPECARMPSLLRAPRSPTEASSLGAGQATPDDVAPNPVRMRLSSHHRAAPSLQRPEEGKYKQYSPIQQPRRHKPRGKPRRSHRSGARRNPSVRAGLACVIADQPVLGAASPLQSQTCPSSRILVATRATAARGPLPEFTRLEEKRGFREAADNTSLAPELRAGPSALLRGHVPSQPRSAPRWLQLVSTGPAKVFFASHGTPLQISRAPVECDG